MSDGLELIEVRSERDTETAPDAFLVLRHEDPVVGRSSRVFLTGAVVVMGVLSDLLFFPHLAYMAAYGGFVAVLGTVVLRRMWRNAAPAGSRDNVI